MGIHIESERVERLAARLATETGLSVADALEKALEDQLARVDRHKEREYRYRRIRELVDSLGPVPADVTSDHSDLYDEWGLPK